MFFIASLSWDKPLFIGKLVQKPLSYYIPLIADSPNDKLYYAPLP